MAVRSKRKVCVYPMHAEFGWGSSEPGDRLQSGVEEFGRICGKTNKTRESEETIPIKIKMPVLKGIQQ